MKNHTEKNNLFKEIRRKTWDHAYLSRLEQELQDHIEDATEEKVSAGKTAAQAETEAVTQLGKAETIAHEYNRAMQPGKLLIIAEALFVGFLTIPSYIISIALMESVINGAFFPPPSSGPMGVGTVLKLWGQDIFIRYGIIILIFLLTYLLLYGTLRKYIAGNKDMWVSYLISLIPPAITVNLYVTLVKDIFDVYQENLHTGIVFTGITIGIGVITGWGTLWYLVKNPFAKKMHPENRLEKIWNTVRVKTPPILGGVFIGYLFLRTLFQWLQELSVIPTLFLEKICALGPVGCIDATNNIPEPLSIIEFIFLNALPQAVTALSPVATTWLTGTILTLVALFCLWGVAHTLEQKYSVAQIHIPYLKLCILIYIVVIIFASPMGKPDLNWHVPAQEITKNIEKSQLGPWYRFTKYVNKGEGGLFWYSISNIGDQSFAIDQTDMREEFYKNFALKNIESTKKYALAKRDPGASQPTTREFTGEKNGVYCDGDRWRIENPLELHHCQKLSLNSRALFDNPHLVAVKDVLLNADASWALITISTGAYNPEYVYLADLR